MIGMRDDLTETPDSAPRMDVLTDILGSLRLTGGVIVDASTAGEFCLASQFTDADYEMVVPSGSGEVVAYHFIRSGRIFASVEGMPPIEATEGDIILLPRNDRHLLYSDPTLIPI